jgi:hypothetical protein
MASIARRFPVQALALLGLALGLSCSQGAAMAGSHEQGTWIEIPTRIDEIKVRYKPMGCKDNICTIEVQGLTKDEAISTELINCKAMTIRNGTSPVSSGWKAIAPGTVDMTMAQKVCHSH